MKILLKNISNTYNYGSMMMAENLISYLFEKNNDVEFYIEAFTESDLERLRTATKNNKIYKDKELSIKLITEKIKYVRVLERTIRRKKHTYHAAKFYDVIIILGGDDFSEIYYKFPKDYLELKFVFDELKIFNKFSKLYMVGQTIGPYYGKRINMAKKAFKNIKIFTRDDETKKYMQEVLNKETLVSRDLAFLDLKLQNEYIAKSDEILNKYNLKKDKYITVVGTGLLKKYTLDENKLIDTFYSLIKELKKTNEKIVCLSHVFTPDGIDDNILYNKINKKYDNYISKNCILIDKPMLPVEARIILGNGRYTVTCRMHAAVSTFQMGKPAICLSYSKKYKGVIADGLKMNSLVIDAKGDNNWNKELVKNIIKKIKYIEKNYSDLLKNINEQVNISQKSVLNMLNDIREEINNFYYNKK